MRKREKKREKREEESVCKTCCSRMAVYIEEGEHVFDVNYKTLVPSFCARARGQHRRCDGEGGGAGSPLSGNPLLAY